MSSPTFSSCSGKAWDNGSLVTSELGVFSGNLIHGRETGVTSLQIRVHSEEKWVSPFIDFYVTILIIIIIITIITTKIIFSMIQSFSAEIITIFLVLTANSVLIKT